MNLNKMGNCIFKSINSNNIENIENENTIICIDAVDESKKKDFTLMGKCISVKVFDHKNIYDGDTFRAQFPIYENSPIEQFRIRTYGYDSPEMKPLKIKKDRDLEIELAYKSKNALTTKIIGNEIIILFGNFDKYGRPLGILFDKQYEDKLKLLNELEIKNLFDEKITGTNDTASIAKTELFNLSINHWMIENNFGKPYFGGTKK